MSITEDQREAAEDVVAGWEEELNSHGERIAPSRRDELVGIVAYADELWPVIDLHGSPLLAWSWDGDPVSGDKIRKLADAIDYLNGYGIEVSIGRSARGYTYINLDLDKFTEETSEDEFSQAF
jgi:hypothetical protein